MTFYLLKPIRSARYLGIVPYFYTIITVKDFSQLFVPLFIRMAIAYVNKILPFHEV